MLKTNRVKEKLRNGGICYGTMLRLVKDPGIIPLCASAGWDFVIFDTEHYDCDTETLSALALTAKYEEMAFLVRVPDKFYHQMARVLDIGAEGLILPRVENREVAEQIIEATKYAPVGNRGASISGNSTLYRHYEAEEFMNWSNSETLIVIQIESAEGVRNLDSILSVQGIDAVLVGPFDLSTSLGIPGQVNHLLVDQACEKVIEACNQYGVAPGIHMSSLEGIEKWRSLGMRFLTYRYDAALLLESSKSALDRFHSTSEC
jgi:4-hydroxy-2-oxoheptanedioate aldolase